MVRDTTIGNDLDEVKEKTEALEILGEYSKSKR